MRQMLGRRALLLAVALVALVALLAPQLAGASSPTSSSGPAVQVDAGAFHACAFYTADGNVNCWGLYPYASSAPTPAGWYGERQDFLAGDVVQLSDSDWDTCVLHASGNSSCVGEIAAAIEYHGGDAIQLVTPAGATCVLTAAHNVKCIGYYFGSDPEAPGAHFVDTYTGGDAEWIVGSSYAMCFKTTGSNILQCSGWNVTEPSWDTGGTPTPHAGGHYAMCILNAGGTVDCMASSYNDVGQTTPPAITNAVDVDSQFDRSCAALATGDITCWGRNIWTGGGSGATYQTWTYSGLGAVSVTVANQDVCYSTASGSPGCIRSTPDAYSPPPPPAPHLATCQALLDGGWSHGDGVYTIAPSGPGSDVAVYCDMTTAGGGWTLVGYGAGSALAGTLTGANGGYNPTSRSGSANLDAVAIARQSGTVALTWSNSAANGGLGSYSAGISWPVPGPAAQTLNPDNGGWQCEDPAHWTQVPITTVVGSPNLPSTMYTRTTSLGASYGNAYGVVRSDGNPQCDWYIDGQGFRAVYLGLNNAPYQYKGVVSEPGGEGNHTVPGTMAIWFRGTAAPADSTAPTAAPVASPAPNGAGWNNSDVTVAWNWADEAGGSGINASACTTSSTSSGEGTLTLSATCADNAGNSGSASVTVKVDKTAPAIAVPATITREAAGPAGAAVTYAAPASDAGSGIASASCSPASGSTFAIGTTTVSCSAADNAGNTRSASFLVRVADTTGPAVTAQLVKQKKGGDDESTQTFKVVFSASDAVGVAGVTATLNGVAVTNGQIVKLKTVKKGAQKVTREDGKLMIQATSFLLTVVARDAAGNATTATAVPVFVKKGKDGEDHDHDDDHDHDGHGDD